MTGAWSDAVRPSFFLRKSRSDLHVGDPVDDRVRAEEEVDAKAVSAGERSRAVVPPRICLEVAVALPEEVAQAEIGERPEPRPLLRGMEDGAVARLAAPRVDRGGHDVEVPAEDRRLVLPDPGGPVLREVVVPLELAPEVLVREVLAVRAVHGGEGEPRDARPDEPRAEALLAGQPPKGGLGRGDG